MLCLVALQYATFMDNHITSSRLERDKLYFSNQNRIELVRDLLETSHYFVGFLAVCLNSDERNF